MCNVQAAYFTKGGSIMEAPCNAILTDAIRVECAVTFSGAEIGKRYSCIFKVRLPNGNIGQGSTTYRTVGQTETFSTDVFQLSAGTYQVTQVLIIDEFGNTVCQW